VAQIVADLANAAKRQYITIQQSGALVKDSETSPGTVEWMIQCDGNLDTLATPRVQIVVPGGYVLEVSQQSTLYNAAQDHIMDRLDIAIA
jgi:hypothetical protein